MRKDSKGTTRGMRQKDLLFLFGFDIIIAVSEIANKRIGNARSIYRLWFAGGGILFGD
jgi:hypothetical protein